MPGFPRRRRLLASAAISALLAAGAVALCAPPLANAAALSTSDLQMHLPSFAPLVDRVKPAVVSVRVKIEDSENDDNESANQQDNLPPELRKFFQHFGGGNHSQREMLGLASGFFISADGYVVTNNHVVEHADNVTVTTSEGKSLDAKVIGTDPKTDLALLKVTEKGDYPFVAFSGDEPKVGDWVVAIGNPFGLGGTVTAGIVSAEGRDIGEGPYDSFLQIDAPINRGNSGGPAFNLQGQVIGVNTAIFSPSGGSVGLGFAIPAAMAMKVIDALEHGGVVQRGFLGVMVQSLSPSLAEGLGLKSAAGALVDQTEANTPAAQTGMQSGDVITKLNGAPVKDAGDLTRRVAALKPGDKADVTFIRSGEEKTVNVTLAGQKAEQTAKVETPANDGGGLLLGAQLAPARRVGAGEQGVAVTNVDPNGVAASKGLTDGDVILEVSGKSVSRPEDVRAEIAAAKQSGKKAVVMKVKTSDGEHFVAFEFPAS
ncbi:MAG: Do family serine endopeptidase [Hyphomicrobiales bacterium]|nr:Do family serine endopeptidase [Hyphomicrobiales bacterium]